MTIYFVFSYINLHNVCKNKLRESQNVRSHVKHTRAIWKVTSGELLTKQAVKKEIYYTQKYLYLSYFST
jgi:hypothetical protein